LVGTGKIDKALIVGHSGGIWAATTGLKPSAEELAAIVKGFVSPSQIQASGIRIEGQKYFAVSANERTIQGKKGGDGLVAVKTKQAVLVALYVAPNQAPEATTIVEKLADYLIDLGF